MHPATTIRGSSEKLLDDGIALDNVVFKQKYIVGYNQDANGDITRLTIARRKPDPNQYKVLEESIYDSYTLFSLSPKQFANLKDYLVDVEFEYALSAESIEKHLNNLEAINTQDIVGTFQPHGKSYQNSNNGIYHYSIHEKFPKSLHCFLTDFLLQQLEVECFNLENQSFSGQCSARAEVVLALHNIELLPETVRIELEDLQEGSVWQGDISTEFPVQGHLERLKKINSFIEILTSEGFQSAERFLKKYGVRDSQKVILSRQLNLNCYAYLLEQDDLYLFRFMRGDKLLLSFDVPKVHFGKRYEEDARALLFHLAKTLPTVDTVEILDDLFDIAHNFQIDFENRSEIVFRDILPNQKFFNDAQLIFQPAQPLGLSAASAITNVHSAMISVPNQDPHEPCQLSLAFTPELCGYIQIETRQGQARSYIFEPTSTDTYRLRAYFIKKFISEFVDTPHEATQRIISRLTNDTYENSLQGVGEVQTEYPITFLTDAFSDIREIHMEACNIHQTAIGAYSEFHTISKIGLREQQKPGPIEFVNDQYFRIPIYQNEKFSMYAIIDCLQIESEGVCVHSFEVSFAKRKWQIFSNGEKYRLDIIRDVLQKSSNMHYALYEMLSDLYWEDKQVANYSDWKKSSAYDYLESVYDIALKKIKS